MYFFENINLGKPNLILSLKNIFAIISALRYNVW